MRRFLVAALLLFGIAPQATAAHYFAVITGVDAEKGTVEYTVESGVQRNNQFEARVTKDCVLKEGYYRLGKPAKAIEGDDIANGLKNNVFKRATAEKPLKVDVFTANEDDPDKGIKKGDVIKILVNPPPKKK